MLLGLLSRAIYKTHEYIVSLIGNSNMSV